jgi:hypothetical protein
MEGLMSERLDELFADWIEHGNGGTQQTVLELIQWSHKQTQGPDHEPGGPA